MQIRYTRQSNEMELREKQGVPFFSFPIWKKQGWSHMHFLHV